MCLLVLSYEFYFAMDLSKVLWTIAMLLIIGESLLTSALTLIALYRFYSVAKNLQPVVTIKRFPIIFQTTLLLIWLLGTVILFCSMIKYYAALDKYENVVRLSWVESI
mmetsp:Transcript_17125/g.21627  ORF Transcript_17125/g.21627 Transcript_17125/m.21627 type:complete len:108 (-) Transcript_17125:930-1253(-)